MSDCVVVTCETEEWRDGYCWIHHQAWQRYLENLPDDSEFEQPVTIVVVRFDQPVRWRKKESCGLM